MSPQTLEHLETVRSAWRDYQAAASRAGRPDVPELDAYWGAVGDLQYSIWEGRGAQQAASLVP